MTSPDIAETVSEDKMTLIERLQNPQWVHGPVLFESPQLDKEQTVLDMADAAAELERVKDQSTIETQKREFAEFEWRRADDARAKAEAELERVKDDVYVQVQMKDYWIEAHRRACSKLEEAFASTAINASGTAKEGG